MRIEPTKGVLLGRLDCDLSGAVDRARVDPSRRSDLSTLIHSAMVFGLEMPVPGFPSAQLQPTLKEVCLSHDLGKQYFLDGPLFVETSWGLRNRLRVKGEGGWKSERLAHPGQLLCEFAKHGIPRTQTLTTEQGTFAVADVIRDVVANYDPNEAEIEWICMALTLYLPPVQQWSDKFGHQSSFDDMANELLNREPDKGDRPCHGIHLLESLALLLRANEHYPILSTTNDARVREYLRGHMLHLVESQLQDGSWPKRWASRKVPTNSRAALSDSDRHARVHVTAHHIGWLLLLTKEMMPSEVVFERAARFLIQSITVCSDEDFIELYCPYSHAAYVLAILDSVSR